MKTVAQNKRLNFLPSKVAHFNHFEAFLYRTAETHGQNYNGGYWEFATATNKDGKEV